MMQTHKLPGTIFKLQATLLSCLYTVRLRREKLVIDFVKLFDITSESKSKVY